MASDESRSEVERPDSEGGFDMRQLAGKRWPVPEWHFSKIEAEMRSPESKDRMMSVVKRMGAQQVPDFRTLDWDAELARFEPFDYPSYYQQPFHSVPGGYLSETAAVGDRCAMEAIYEDAHPRRSLGIREELASLVPSDARCVLDLGGGTGDGGAAIARALPDAQVTVLEASPFMIIAGRKQNAGPANLRFVRGLAEDTGLEAESVDAIAITLVLHECPDKVKSDILAECQRLLRPGGMLVLTDTAQDDLHSYRGFYEPYKEQWSVFDPVSFLRQAGFDEIEARDVAPPLWSRVARKPA
jgi:SAM-dependent methyltransferase